MVGVILITNKKYTSYFNINKKPPLVKSEGSESRTEKELSERVLIFKFCLLNVLTVEF